MSESNLFFPNNFPVKACNAGEFISTGKGKHPKRIIDSFELIYVRSGCLKIREEEIDFAVRENQYLILWPQRKHYGTAEYGDGLSFYWLHFYFEEMDTADMVAIPQYGTVSRPESMVELFRRFLDDQESGCSFPIEKDILTMLLLCEAIRPKAHEERVGQAAILAERANAYILTHLGEDLSRSVIADYLKCNPDYLGRIFHKVYHRNITDTIHHYRYKRALQLLRDTNDTIEEISRLCGYSSVRYFRMQFKRRKGMTPKAYRSLFTRSHINTQ